jgi:hypothetical protein
VTIFLTNFCEDRLGYLDKELVEHLKRKDCIIDSVTKPVSIDSLMRIIEKAIPDLNPT